MSASRAQFEPVWRIRHTVRLGRYEGPPGATLRPVRYDYQTAGGKITSSSTPRPQPFTWGMVVRVHIVGDDYAIVEYEPRQASNVSDEDFDPSPSFSVFVRGARGASWDTHHSCDSLDLALIFAVSWKYEQRNRGLGAAANSRASWYISRLLEMGS